MNQYASNYVNKLKNVNIKCNIDVRNFFEIILIYFSTNQFVENILIFFIKLNKKTKIRYDTFFNESVYQ